MQKNNIIYVKFIAAFVFVHLCFITFAQTPLSSQIFSFTSFSNPSTVGLGLNNQMNSFFRSQYAGVGDAYNTIGVAADFKIFNNDKESPNNFGMGISAVSEKVLNGILQSNYISVSFADRIFLNKLKNSYLALGLGATLISRTVDRAQLTFGDQYNSGRLFNSTSMDIIASYPLRYASNVGISYGKNSEDMFLKFGASGYYINRTANYQTYNAINQSFQLNAFINLEHRVWENQTIMLHSSYQNRLEAEYFVLGGALGYALTNNQEKNSKIYFGCFYRTNDAILPYIGLILEKYKIGISYDIYQNNMTSANMHPQAFEFSLTTSFKKMKSDYLSGLLN